MAAEAGGTALPHCGDPVLSRASLGQLLEKGLVCSRGHTATLLSSPTQHRLCDGDHRWDW